ncbi:MAG: Rid family hydrolase, partial [Oscillospiraceae bacterium]|nr:Rid family hydrolase [Oscillospiraceae bacterium]
MSTVIHTENAPAAVGPYSQAMDCGEFVFCSGQIPLVPTTGLIVEGGIE